MRLGTSLAAALPNIFAKDLILSSSMLNVAETLLELIVVHNPLSVSDPLMLSISSWFDPLRTMSENTGS